MIKKMKQLTFTTIWKFRLVNLLSILGLAYDKAYWVSIHPPVNKIQEHTIRYLEKSPLWQDAIIVNNAKEVNPGFIFCKNPLQDPETIYLSSANNKWIRPNNYKEGYYNILLDGLFIFRIYYTAHHAIILPNKDIVTDADVADIEHLIKIFDRIEYDFDEEAVDTLNSMIRTVKISKLTTTNLKVYYQILSTSNINNVNICNSLKKVLASSIATWVFTKKDKELDSLDAVCFTN